jgi:glutamine amidotransferase
MQMEKTPTEIPDAVIVDVGLGNAAAIVNIIRYLGGSAIRSKDVPTILNAKRIILPGVGTFDEGMRRLNCSGLRPVLDYHAVTKCTPILGICLGMQMMTRESEEGVEKGMSWIRGRTKRFSFAENYTRPRVPHIGWASVSFRESSGLGDGILKKARFYFVHSYHVELDDSENDWLCKATYGVEFVAGFRSRNLIGVQFHPEKSHRYGIEFFRAFLQMPPGVTR